MTPLDKDLSRESTSKFDNREIQVTLTADQKISFKLKGMKSGVVSIGIEELYQQLSGDEIPVSKDVVEDVVIPNTGKDNPMVPLNILRTKINTTPMEIETKAKLDTIIVESIAQYQKPFLEKERLAKEKKSESKTIK